MYQDLVNFFFNILKLNVSERVKDQKEKLNV